MTTLFSSEMFMPHGHCYLWQPALVWLQVTSNGAIAAAYVAIFSMLVYLVRRIRDIPFQWMYVAFAVFIVACGVTHIMDVYVIWSPAYWTDGGVRALTAVASVGTALMLPPLIPKAVALADAATVAHKRGLELEHANKELAVLLDKTKELEQLKTAFFANVSHELRTPLALILGPLQELLAAGDLKNEQRDSLELVHRNARTLLGHVNDLLDAAKFEANKLEVQYADVDIAKLVRLAASHFESLASERGISYEVKTPDSARAQVDPSKLQRVLLNLLSNAFKFTPEHGAVRCTMTVSVPAEVAHIEVSDSGPGIRPEHREIAFERFRQLEGGTTRRFGGTGLGLAIARDFVELQHGNIRVDDAEQGGALFRVELPLRAPLGTKIGTDAVQVGQLEDVLPLPPSQPGSSKIASMHSGEDQVEQADGAARARVLVVEDNLDLNRFVTSSLAQQYRVTSADNGRAGLALARKVRPDVIVTDLMMPEMSGDELLRAVRADELLRDTPLIVLTAKADDDVRLQILRDGAQDYIFKPFSAEELRVRVGGLVTLKRARDVLRADLDSQAENLEELAEQVTARQRELKTAMESLRVARDQAMRASEVKTNFLNMVSHELRTPLTVVRLQIDRLSLELLPAGTDKQKSCLQRLERGSLRLEQLVDSLLDYARIQSGRLDLQIEPSDLRAIILAVADEMRPQAEQKQLALEVCAPEGLPRTHTDPRLTHLMIVNLVANAIKFTKAGRVEITLEIAGDRRLISVSDTGPGVPDHERARIFEPFEQLEAIRQKHTAGVGLGLAIVREMANALKGEVRLESELGKGSTFTLVLADLTASADGTGSAKGRSCQ